MFDKKKLFIGYLFYVTIISLCAFFFAFLFQRKFYVLDNNYNIILENITFEFGNLLKNLFYNGNYYQIIEGTKFYLNKLPAVPLLLYFICKISLNYFFVVIFKNIFLFSIYFFCSYFLVKDLKDRLLFISILLIPIVIPYNFLVALNYVYEDNLIAIILPLLYLSLISENKNRFIFISLILFTLYFIKTSMFLLVLIIPFFILVIEKKIRVTHKLLPLLFSILAIVFWGYFGYFKTGRFPFGSAAASNNSYVLSFVLNKEFKNYYPDKSTDLIPVEKPEKPFNSEWEYYDYYNLKNKIYLRDNLSLYIKDIGLKLNFIFFGVHVDGNNSQNTNSVDNPIRYSSIFSKFFLNLSILLSIYVLVGNYRNLFKNKKELYFIAVAILNLIPHIVGWATSKHLIGISNISLIYLIFFIKDKYYVYNK